MATLRLGTLDLSAYLDVQPGAGMDPASAAFSDRVISHSLLKEGGTLAITDMKVKELAFPLFLKATNKDLLHSLVEQINFAIEVTGQTATFQDDGATMATTFDVVSGQLDIEYDFRRAQINYLHARLRLFVQPLGRTAAPRLIASVAASGPVITFSTASPLLGDARALPVVSLTTGNFDYPGGGGGGQDPHLRYAAFAQLPGPSYSPLFTASQLYIAGFSQAITGGSSAVASIYLRTFLASISGTTGTYPIGRAQLPVSIYSGRNRVLVIMRPVIGPSLADASIPLQRVYMEDDFGNTYPTVTLYNPGQTGGTYFLGGGEPSLWQMYDMGVVSVPSGAHPTLPNLYLLSSHQLLAASVGIDVTGLILLPDNSTTFVSEPQVRSAGLPLPIPMTNPNGGDTYVWDELQQSVTRIPFAPSPVFADRGRFMDDLARGAVPRPIGGNLAYWAAMSFCRLANDTISVSLSAYERTRYLF